MDVLSEVIDELYQSAQFNQDGEACNEFQVCWIRQGRGWVSWPDSAMPLPVYGDDVILAPAGTRFWVQPRADLTHLALETLRCQIRLRREVPHPLLSLLDNSPLKVVQHSPVSNCFRPIQRELERSRPGHQLALENWSQLLFLTVLRSFHIHGERSWISALRRRSLRQAMEAIHRAPEKLWTRETLAREVGLSSGGLSRSFSTWTGMLLTDYLRLWRVHRAASLLQQKDLSVSQIAQQCGYRSRTGLTKAVQHVTGLSLAELRRH